MRRNPFVRDCTHFVLPVGRVVFFNEKRPDTFSEISVATALNSKREFHCKYLFTRHGFCTLDLFIDDGSRCRGARFERCCRSFEPFVSTQLLALF